MLENFTKWSIEQLYDFWKLAFPWVSTHGVSIVIILSLAFIAKSFGVKIVNEIVTRTVRDDVFPTKSDQDKRIKTLTGLVSASLSLIIWIVAGLLIVSELKPSYAGALFASAGVLGIAVGFGAQSLIKDFTSGMFIIIENQYRVGDVISLGALNGTVESISIRKTTLRDLSGNVHHIPNGTIAVTTNKTMDFGMLHEDITVTNKTSIDTIEKIIKHISSELLKDEEIKNHIIDPVSLVEVTAYDSFGLTFKVCAKTTAGKQWLMRDLFFRSLKHHFENEHIEFPDIAVTKIK